MRIEYHRTLIADTVRNAAFHAAMKALITPGKTRVADIGTGTGVLGLMASRLGAKEVYLYETAEVATVAREILKKNRARNCQLIPCHSTEMVDPPAVDLVVSETLGNYALEENIHETCKDAVARHLAPGGLLVPARITQFVAPVVAPRIHHELTAWDRFGYGIDLSFARLMSLNNIYVRGLEEADLLDGGGSATMWDEIDLYRDHKGTRKGEARWRLTAPTRLYGFAVWWDVSLAPGIALSTGPGGPRTHWEQLYLPLLEPLEGKSGTTLTVALRSRSSTEGGTHVAWTACLLDAKGKSIARQTLDLDRGFLP